MYGRIDDIDLALVLAVDMNHFEVFIIIQVFLQKPNAHLNVLIRLVCFTCHRILQSDVKSSRKRHIFRGFSQLFGGLGHVIGIFIVILFDFRYI